MIEPAAVCCIIVGPTLRASPRHRLGPFWIRCVRAFMIPRAWIRPQTSEPTSPGRREWMLVGLILVAGFGIRAAFPGRMAVEHFDEGVYASNIFFGADRGFQYPARHLYAPPLWPWLVEWSIIFFGPTHWGTMLVGVVSGTLTALVVWRLVRESFGIAPGLTAAALCAFNDYHALYSRTALTEPLLCFWLAGAVYFLFRALTDGNRRSVILAGLFTGLAWWTKYNGWLPLAIGTAGLAAWAIRPHTASPKRGRRFLILLVIGMLAGLVFLPVWWDLRDVGGYKAVQENHARYFVGLAGWATAWQRQLANLRFFDGPLSWIGLVLAVFLSRWGSRIEPRRSASNETAVSRGVQMCWCSVFAAILAAAAYWLGTSVVLGLLGFVWLVLACPWWARNQDAARSGLAYWLSAAWFAGLFLATPLYTPYPRLCAALAHGGMDDRGGDDWFPRRARLLSGQYDWQAKRWSIALTGLVAVAGIFSAGMNAIQNDGFRVPAWQDRTGLEHIAARIENLDSRQNRPPLIYVYAEPALFFHLRAEGLEAVAPVADLQFAEMPAEWPTFLVVGPHAERSEAFQRQWRDTSDRFERIARFRDQPSDLVLLNQYPPKALKNKNFSRAETISIYRLKSR